MPKYRELVLEGPTLPNRLLDLPDPPARLYLHGELPRGPAVAIVGTREPTPAARKYTRKLARELAQSGVAILSGGAFGVDVEAHRGALDAGGVTVVVAPSGWDKPSPEEHWRVFRRAVRTGGAHVSLEPSPKEARRAAYFGRNAVLAALAHVVVVIEAPFKSGARNTAATARRLGRPLFVCAAPPWTPNGHGCLEELRLGARPLLSMKDVQRALRHQQLHAVSIPALQPVRAQQLALEPIASAPEKSSISEHEHAVTRIVETIRGGAAYPDDLCSRTGLSPQRVQQLVLTLRLDGVLVSDASGRLRLVSR